MEVNVYLAGTLSFLSDAIDSPFSNSKDFFFFFFFFSFFSLLKEFSVINIIVNNATDTAQCTNTIEVNILFYVLGGSSAVVSLLVLWQLINLCSVSRETGLKYEGKRLFHWVLFGSLLGRSFFCFVSPSICRLPLFPYIFLYIWINHSLEMVFFFAFFLLSTFWTDIITSLRGPGGLCSTGCLRGGLLVVTLFVVAVVLVFLGLFLGRTGEHLEKKKNESFFFFFLKKNSAFFRYGAALGCNFCWCCELAFNFGGVIVFGVGDHFVSSSAKD